MTGITPSSPPPPPITHDREPPNSMEAEVSVLGGLLIDKAAIDVVVDTLTESMFYRESHRRLYRAAVAINERGDKIDPILIVEQLKATNELDAAGGHAYLAKLLDAVPTAANIEAYAKVVAQMSVRRQLITVASDTIRDAHDMGEGGVDAVVATAEDRIQAIELPVGEDFRRIKDSLWGTFETIEKWQEVDEDATGISTGFRDVDRMTTGLHPGDLWIVAARPSMGKTSWTMNVAANVAIHSGEPVAIESLEMGREALTMRMLASEGRVDLQHVRRGTLDTEEYQRLAAAAGHLNPAPLFIDDNPTTGISGLRAKCRRVVRREGIKLLIVDYIQLIEGEGRRSRVEDVSDISRGLKKIAVELDIPVIAVSQLSRAPEQRNEKRPQLSDLRDSGSIEQDADLVMFVYRPEYYLKDNSAAAAEFEGKAEMIIAKQRNGPTGTVQMYFHKAYTRFDEMAHNEGMER